MHIDIKQANDGGISITPAAVAAAEAVLSDAFRNNVFRDNPAAGEKVLKEMFPGAGNGAGAGISTLDELSKVISSGKKTLSKHYFGRALQQRERAYTRAGHVAVTIAAEVDGITLLYPSRSL